MRVELEKFKQEYCLTCGSQRCTRENEWLEGCPHYRDLFSLNRND